MKYVLLSYCLFASTPTHRNTIPVEKFKGKLIIKENIERRTERIHYVFLSYILSATTPVYGTNPVVEILQEKRISSGDPANTFMIKFHNHSGTHIDAPKHFWDQGRGIAEYRVEELIFNSPLVIDCKTEPGEMIDVEVLTGYEELLDICDILLLRTGFWQYREKGVYRMQNPGITPDFAKKIRSNYPQIHAIGVDSISVSSYAYRERGRETHKILLQKGEFEGEPLLLVEDMDLSDSDLDKLKTIIVAPLRVKDIDSSPCVVIGVIRAS